MPASGTPAQAAQKRRIWPGASAAGKSRRRETGDELALEAYSLALHSYRVVFSEEPASFRRVSVLIPCFGKAAWLEECVRSVLAQTKPADNICILLMDRKSRRMKAGLEALSPAVRCICSERLGVCRARNVLAQNCPTEFFVFLDADDTLAPDFLEKTSARRADFVFSSCRILENGIIRERVELPSDLPCPFLCNNLTGIFGLPDMSGVGISFGADRIYDVLKGLDKFPEDVTSATKILFANMGTAEVKYLLPVVRSLRESGVSCEIFAEPAKLKKQFDYADRKSVPFISITGGDEMAQGVVNLKNLSSGAQESFRKDDIEGILKFVGIE